MGLRRSEIELWIEVPSDWRAADKVQVYTDFGTGTVDTDRPLLGRPARLFPYDYRDRVALGGYGSIAYGLGAHGGGVNPGTKIGYGLDPYASQPYGGCQQYVTIRVAVDAGYGNWKFAAQAIDGAGNEQGALVEFTKFVAGELPPRLATFGYSSYSSPTDTVTFSVAV